MLVGVLPPEMTPRTDEEPPPGYCLMDVESPKSIESAFDAMLTK